MGWVPPEAFSESEFGAGCASLPIFAPGREDRCDAHPAAGCCLGYDPQDQAKPEAKTMACLLYTSPSPRDRSLS
eukprot:282967-Pyramimonas_sp.AAC.1